MAPCCSSGLPRRERYVGREGRMAWRGPQARLAVCFPSRPVLHGRCVASAASVQWARASPQPWGPSGPHPCLVNAHVSGSRRLRPGAQGIGQPSKPRAGAWVRHRRTVVRCPPTSWAMVLRVRPRCAIQIAWPRARRRRAVVVWQRCATWAWSVAASLIRLLFAPPSRASSTRGYLKQRYKIIRCMYQAGVRAGTPARARYLRTCSKSF